MRNIPIPVDITALSFVCVSAPRPRLVSQETGQVKIDKQGRTVFQVGLSVADEATGRAEIINVNVSGDPQVTLGQIVTPVGLIGFPWEQIRDGEKRWGIAYRAASIVPAAPSVAVA
ncbi:hypothetical protein [Actinomadura sp. HBU206391]|uniref:SCO3933 family regulatory protein n=1 Tax=Actinomadura sp. HBU206391 TaxID=2731692 RepID=UPI00164FC0EC|nr:hypothetical protein [Actinomadura sp. HBU206391]MBC6462415.1 hypothetical protein [Actinomadura sp. HBU206391]